MLAITLTLDSRRSRARSRVRGVRRLSIMALLGVAVAGVSGCGLRDFELDLNLPDPLLSIPIAYPGLADVPPRLALGGIATVQVLGGDEARVYSSDSSVVVAERTNEQVVLLTAVGVGSATIQYTGDGQTKRYNVRVDNVARSEVLFVEPGGFVYGPIEVVEADEMSFLSGVGQQLVAAHYDSEGELLYGEGLATSEILAGAEPCEVTSGAPLDEVCFVLQPGENVIRFESPVEVRDITMHGVTEAEIVDLIVLQTEGIPEEGDTVGLVSFGLTDEDTWVFGVHAEYVIPNATNPAESFAYEHDPAASEQTVSVSAVGFEREVVIRGESHLLVSHPRAVWTSCGETIFLEPCQ